MPRSNLSVSPSRSRMSRLSSNGVTRMEGITRATQSKTGSRTLWAVGASIFLCAWAYSLDHSTTSNLSVLATSSFGDHSGGLASLSIATNIISAVSKPFVAKVSDITSRPYTYILVLIFYATGYSTVALCRSITVYISGEVLVSIGSAGLDLLNEVITGDLTPLEWRGFAGSVLSLPFIVNTYFSGKIVEALKEGDKWRWGYGMFAIILPVVLSPAIITLIALDRQAQQHGLVNIASSNAARRDARALAEAQGFEGPRGGIMSTAAVREETWTDLFRRNLREIDAVGLVLLAAGWAFILLPFSMKAYKNGGFFGSTMISLFTAGVLFLISYAYWERYHATVPSAPKRLLLNKTFICAVIIDFVYFLAGMMRGLYFGSYVLIVKDWSYTNWAYFNNLMTISLCIFGVVAGLLQRYFHRYKALQITGLSIKIVGMFLLVRNGTGSMDTPSLIIQQILIGGGGAFSVVGSRVAAQASVALLALWTKIGAAIGSAIAFLVWNAKMPSFLRLYMGPLGVPESRINEFFGNIRIIRDEYALEDPIRQAAIKAYTDTVWYLFVPALMLSFIPLIAACFQTNFYLGEQQNAVMNVGTDGRRISTLSKKSCDPRRVSFPVGPTMGES
ncbi:major facilitator superfamily domain-containing protein [Flagelloscypha sp. PMI_526]|nr:major facilitator superfamily domain-containing protein [Flagelloscypha sp. PMI_526]